MIMVCRGRLSALSLTVIVFNFFFTSNCSQGFLQLQKFNSRRTIAACHILALVLGEEGSGKTTVVESAAATTFLKQLFKKEDQKDMGSEDIKRRTTGMEFSTFVDELKNTIHFIDYAGQSEFALTHDLFSVRMPIPTVAFVVVNATQSGEDIERRIMDAASVLIGRQTPGSLDGKRYTIS